MRTRTANQRAAALALCALLAAPLPARAQEGADMAELVVDWARGRFASPVLCEIEGELIRGIRRVVIRPGAPGASRGRRAGLSLQFVDMRPDGASRCINALGVAQPNVLGRVELRLPGAPHPETGLRDFKQALRRERGFELEVVSGVLKLQPVSDPPSAARTVDYRGGRAGLHLVLPASDDEKALADFPSPRKAVLTLQPKSPGEGEALRLPLFLTEER